MSSSYLISVVVCTYNRSELLQTCLESLAHQIVITDKHRFEVIIVDNNSTDSTQEISRRFVDNYPDFKIVLERSQGLSHARNRGWQEAKGKYVAYIDDDAKAYSNWIKSITDFTIQCPTISAFGGPYFAYSVDPVPEWFPGDYGSMSLGDTVRFLGDNEWLSGTNMIYRRSLLSRLDGFKTEYGMTGEIIAYGEEIELLQRIKDDKISICYVPYICVFHLIMPRKLSLRFLLKSCHISGLDAARIVKRPSSKWRKLLNFSFVCLSAGCTFVVCKEKHIKTRLYRALRPVASGLGVFLFAFGISGVSKNEGGNKRRLLTKFKKVRMSFILKKDIKKYKNNYNVIIGAGETEYIGWISTDYPALDISEPKSLGIYFPLKSIRAILSEHVFEHLTSKQTEVALAQCRDYLVPGGYLRIAVPDGFHPDSDYINSVKPGGYGDGSHDHQVLYNYKSLTMLLQKAGFRAKSLEWYDQQGRFHSVDWKTETGFIKRSSRFDKRNQNNKLRYTSLIIDAVKN